jgi:hypothetical protein
MVVFYVCHANPLDMSKSPETDTFDNRSDIRSVLDARRLMAFTPGGGPSNLS